MTAYGYAAALAALLTLSLAGAAHAQIGATPFNPAPSPAPGSPASGPVPAGAPEVRNAERLNRQGEHELALSQVEAYLKAHPDDSAGRFLRGVILTDLGRNQEALEVFRLLTIDHPELEQPYNNMGVLYAQSGQLQRARQSLEQAVQANPQSALALENLGDIYARLAEETYEKVTTIDTANRAVRSKLALARNLANAAAGTSAPANH